MMGDRRQRLWTVPGYLIAILAGAILMTFINSYNPQIYFTKTVDNGENRDIETKLILQRNAISETLNRQQQRIGVLQCEVRLFVYFSVHSIYMLGYI